MKRWILLLAALLVPRAVTRRAATLAQTRLLCGLWWDGLAGGRPPPAFLVVGACDGVKFDDISPWARRIPGATALFIEPIPFNLERLRANFPDRSRFRIEPVAVTDRPGALRMRTFDPEAMAAGRLPEYVQGMSSSTGRNGLAGRGNWGAVDPAPDGTLDRFLRDIEVPGEPLRDILARHGDPAFDVVVIDTEGADWVVLSQLDLERAPPRLIRVEVGCLPAGEIGLAVMRLRRAGYEVSVHGADLVAILDGPRRGAHA